VSNDSKIARLEERVEALEAISRGECPDCGQRVAGYKTPFGTFAPEMWATLRERGIDPASGHKATCGSKGKYR